MNITEHPKAPLMALVCVNTNTVSTVKPVMADNVYKLIKKSTEVITKITEYSYDDCEFIDILLYNK